MTDSPETAGHYWAKWRTANDGTRDAAEVVPSEHWEVVEVFENRLDCDADEYLMVNVPGVDRSQGIENFIWGPGPLPPPTVLEGVTQSSRQNAGRCVGLARMPFFTGLHQYDGAIN